MATMRKLHDGLSKVFVCEGCGDRVKKAAYCIAQQASGHDINYECPKCKHTMLVPR